jgi:hypothetical protein
VISAAEKPVCRTRPMEARRLHPARSGDDQGY